MIFGKKRPPFQPGKWGLSETWPEGAKSPQFELCWGERVVAVAVREKEGWRLRFDRVEPFAAELDGFVETVQLLFQRLKDPSNQG